MGDLIINDVALRFGDNDVLLFARLRPVDGQRLDQALTYRDSRYLAGPALARLEPGLAAAVTLDAHVMRVAVACDGERPLGELVSEVADQLGVDEGWLRSISLPAVRELLGLGLLAPA